MLKTIKVIIIIVFSILVCTTCKHQLDVKDFIEKGFDAAKFIRDVEFTPSVTDRSIHYLPSGQRITVTVPIGNRHGQELSGTVSVPADKTALFDQQPIVKTITPYKAVIEFILKSDAEPNAASNFLTQPIPLTLKVDVKNQGREFGSRTIPLYCNTRPVKPHSYTTTADPVQYNPVQDSFTFQLPDKPGIHKDLHKIEATVDITPHKGSGRLHKKVSIELTESSTELLPRSYELKLADIFAAVPPGIRSCSLALYDKTGLSVPLADKNAELYFIDSVTLNAVSASWEESKSGIKLPMIKELQPYTQHKNGTDALTDWSAKDFTVTAAAQNGKLTFADGVLRSNQTDGAAFTETVTVTVTDKRGVQKIGQFTIQVGTADSPITDVYITAGDGNTYRGIKQSDGSYKILMKHGVSYNDTDITMSLRSAVESWYNTTTAVSADTSPLAETAGSTKTYMITRNTNASAPASQTNQTCMVTVERDKNYRAYLSGITINGTPFAGFAAHTFDYPAPILIPAAVDSVPVTVALATTGADDSTGAAVTINGSAGTSLSVPIAAGSTQQVTITVTPEKPSASVNTYTITLKRKGNFTVKFKVKDGQGGSLKASYNGTDKTAGAAEEEFDVEEGDSISFTALPQTDWAVEQWTGFPAPVLGGTTAVLSNITADHTITVVFNQIDASVLKLKQDFNNSDTAFHTIAAADKEYITEDIVPDAAQYPHGQPLVLYNKDGKARLSLKKPLGATAHYSLTPDGGSATSGSGNEISFNSTGTYKLEIWTEKNGTAGTKTTLYIAVKNAVTSYGELKKTVKNTPNYGSALSEYTYGAAIKIGMSGTLTAADTDTEIAVSDRKKLELCGLPSSTINAADRGRIFKISGTGTELMLENITLNGGSAADGKGGAVCVEDGCTLALKGSSVITPSTGSGANTAGKNDVYLNSGATITLPAVLSSSVPVARITPAAYTEGTSVLTGGAVSTEHGKFRVTQQTSRPDYLWSIKRDGTLQGAFSVIKGSDQYAWKKLKESVEHFPAGGTIVIEGLVQSTTASGNNGEIIIDKDLTIEAKTGTATLDANESAFSTGEDKHRIFSVKGGATLTLKNLTLKNGYAGKSTADNLGTTGGGIRLESGTVSLSGVTISGCKARTTPVLGGTGSWHGEGGGIYVISGTIIMENTTLSANNAHAYGGAVYLNGGTLTMKGSSVITPSTVSNANKTGKNDVHLENGAKIIVDGVLTGTAPVARIKVAYNEYLPTRQVLDGTAVASHNTKFIVTDQDLGTDNGGVHVRKWNIKSNGYLQSEGVTLDGSETRAWQALKDAVRTASDGDVIAINGTIQATNAGYGNYVDNGEIVIDKNLTIKAKSGTATLDANKGSGGKPKHRIFKVKSGNTLTLENLTLKGGIAEMSDMDGGGVYVETSGKLIMTGSSITDCEAIGDTVGNKYGEGGGVCNKGTVEMTGGEIKNNKARNGGGVHNRGTLILTNATLTGNTATFIGGALCLSFGTSSEMTGGKIISNTCSGTSGGGVASGGGVYIHAGTFKLNSSASIESNTASYGGGAYVNQNGTLIINGGSIKLNKAQSRGGGVYVSGNSTERGTLRMIQGDISDNGAGWNGTSYTGTGGGVYNEGGTVEISGGEIKSNTAKNGGGIYVKDAGATLTMSGGTISANKAVTDPSAPSEQQGGAGGGIVIGSGAKLTISGSAVVGGEQYHDGTDTNKTRGNSAAVGGGIYLMKGSEKTKITGGSITYNKADSIGGGIYMMDNGAEAEMTGGSITHNKADVSGGGVYISDYNSTPRSLFTLKGGTVSYNTAKNGGGITAFGDFNMDGGSIEENTATGDSDPSLNLGTGGGIDLVAATMNMTGGEIKKNKAKRGGGVSLGLSGARDAVFNMSGGTISGNTLTETSGKGAGVEFFTESTTHSGTTYYTRMKMSGSAKVDTNNDVYLNNSRMITVDGVLTGTAPAACITPKTYVAGRKVLDGSKVSSEHIKFSVTPNGSEHWIVGNSGTLLNFGAISLNEIKARESSMSSALITNRENLVNKLLFYKTSAGNYGVMVITEVNATSHSGRGHIKFNYKTFNADGSVKNNRDNCELEGVFSFDLDADGNDYDFFLNNSSTQNLAPQNGAKFYVLP